jgi:hypothetical protein
MVQWHRGPRPAKPAPAQPAPEPAVEPDDRVTLILRAAARHPGARPWATMTADDIRAALRELEGNQ